MYLRTSDAGSQYRCGQVGRGIQPPSTPHAPPQTHQPKKHLKRQFFHFLTQGRMVGQSIYRVACPQLKMSTVVVVVRLEQQTTDLRVNLYWDNQHLVQEKDFFCTACEIFCIAYLLCEIFCMSIQYHTRHSEPLQGSEHHPQRLSVSPLRSQHQPQVLSLTCFT